ncbi:hypothetical protein SLEP1_g7934 [Rubroshorea leprosula]|uniref:Phospholipase A1 n=1 Tax=Rubroshorea leprosula TaxID=152421 RepID=A0AAV5I932_9ROSI|nr:hypothetical protein SLEP1_g7934 [Rubroshorea leprosula]
MGSIVKNWRELSGENNWERLLNPLDSDLCRFIVHCGERTQAIEDSVHEWVQEEVKRLVKHSYYKENGQVSITVTGHSVGAALATLNAVDLVVNQYNKPSNGSDNSGCMVSAIVSGCPRIGNDGFSQFLSRLKGIHILRITNADDPVPNLPKWLQIRFTYTHVGKELKINGVANTPDGEGETLEREYKLLNKFEDIIKEEYHVQPAWWVEMNKDMVQLDDGSWGLDLKYYAPIQGSDWTSV